MNIQILHLIEGVKQAQGLAVIIDVFRAFSVECYLYDMGVREIRPVGTIKEAFGWQKARPDVLLIGERHGKKCDGFQYGNSPSSFRSQDIEGRFAVHTTSAGTQGIINATHASEIITGSLVNTKAVAEYIRQKQPETVSLVCMGNGGVRPAEEDGLCAEYIKSILEGKELPDIQKRAHDLQFRGGKHFFDPNQQEVFPEPDFWLCTQVNRFSFVLRMDKDEDGFIARKITQPF